MITFRGLWYEEYKTKTKDVDQDVKERKIDHYTSKSASSPEFKTNHKFNDKFNDKSNIKNLLKAGKSSTKPQLFRDEMMK